MKKFLKELPIKKVFLEQFLTDNERSELFDTKLFEKKIWYWLVFRSANRFSVLTVEKTLKVAMLAFWRFKVQTVNGVIQVILFPLLTLISNNSKL